MGNMEYTGKCLCLEVEGKKILVVGDLHLGYEEALNESGIFVTRGMFKEMIGYLDRIFDSVGKMDYVVLLGDVKHDFGRILRQERNDLMTLFEYFGERLNVDGKIVIVKGNHDKIIEYVAKTERVEIKDYLIVGEYCFVHGDREFAEMRSKEIKYWIMGHGHPAIKISDGVKVEKYKCFLVGKYEGKRIIIVPSFLEYNEGSDPRENDLGIAWDFNYDKFDVKVVDSENLKVLDFGILGKID